MFFGVLDRIDTFVSSDFLNYCDTLYHDDMLNRTGSLR